MKQRITLDIVADFADADIARIRIIRTLVEQLQPPLVTSWYTIEHDTQTVNNTAKETLP